MLRLLLASAAATALIALSPRSASAQSWTGTTSNDWMVGSNWSGGAVPIAGNVVNINTTSPNPTILGVGGAATGATGQLTVGNTTGSFGNLTIQNGSTLTSNAATIAIGVAGGSNGTVTVSGAGSQWTTSGTQIEIGASGNGTLNIQNGAKVVAQAGVLLGSFATGTGTLNISGGSTLETTTLSRPGAGGVAQINFDNAILRARINSVGFISGFSSGVLNIAAGGLTVDTQAFTVSANNGFSGVGGLTKIGAGTLNLRASNTYTGATVIQAGTLALASSGSVAASSRVVANGTFNISGITAAGTNIQSLAGTGTVVLGAKSLTITNANDVFAGVIGGTGGLTLTGGTQTLAGANTYNGATNVNAGILRAAAANTLSAASAFTVASGGTLDLAGFNQTLASLDNAGIVSLGGAPGTTLTVTGNYVGNGGTVQLNTRLGGDSSPTDLLRVQGSTSGASSLRVTNVGGSGAQTVEGIKVVDVVGASNGSFSLLGNYVLHGEQAVVGGAYAYTLQKNGIATPGDGDWYLRSSLINPPVSAPSGPLYQPGVPLYENYAQVLLGMNDLPTLQQRAGNRYWGGSDAMARAGSVLPVPGVASPTPTAFWGRIEGGHSDLQPSNTTGSTTKADQLKVQTGLDGLALENERGRLIVGLTAQYGLTTADVASFYGNGRIRVEGTGVGATLTWYGDNGFYVDGQVQSMFYRSDLSSALAGSMTHGNEGVGYAFSAETGKRIGLGNGWSLTPQAQLSYAKVAFDNFVDRFGAPVSLRDGDSLLGRAGLALDHQKTWNDGTGIVRSDVYGIANLRYEFLNGTKVDVAGTGFANAQDRLWASIGGGGTYSWANGRYAIFGEVSYNASLDNSSDNRNYKGTGGFRLTW
ncbi:autotransporter outer membrane beta-barrel domain-containing protein [Bradyrhizobium nitroreducens]|uniref:autotransporter family protein n=1 Tax=Bradyrhizobium nitroreducens TaxID=709803 RepID=UPI0013753127|nr:autotransporter outer membrane beta-barrel domain-containing protein [Bradyrhizobium nitroreducens]